MKRIWSNWKEKWGIESDRRMIWIFVIFAITGSTTMFVRKGLFAALGIEVESPVLAVVVRILAIYLIYQLLLFTIGSLLGEHKFFWWFIKKMNRRMIGKKTE